MVSSRWDIHRPVLLEETLTMLRIAPGGIYMDGTLGLGGHTREILKRSTPSGRVVAFEWDEAAIKESRKNIAEYESRLTVIRRNFAEIEVGLAEAGFNEVNGILVDVGLSSLQLDMGKRGFSFQKDEPLDMRMDQRREKTAETVLNTASEKELADIFYYYGEEKQSRRIAARIADERRRGSIKTSGQLAELVGRAIPRKFHPPKIHVATKVFQALRIAVNEELSNLSVILDKAADHLAAGGRFCVISFHSLEDRLVKKKFAASDRFTVITRKPIVPSNHEVNANRRARSARLRVAERLA